MATSGKKKGRKLVRAISAGVYIVVCYFSLIICSTVELTSLATCFTLRELCSLLVLLLDKNVGLQEFCSLQLLGKNIHCCLGMNASNSGAGQLFPKTSVFLSDAERTVVYKYYLYPRTIQDWK